MPKADPQFVESEIEANRGITCHLCSNALTESDDEYGDGLCWSCREYQKDCQAGLFDDWGVPDTMEASL